ncbi:MAG: PEP-CTERM sorting domain-containing protein [Planctomycetota bacterium]
MKKLLAFSVVLVFVATASADWFDDFDSYADQPAFDAVYTQLYPAVPLMLDQSMGYSDGQSVNPGPDNVNYTVRAYKNFGEEVAGTDANPLVFEFMYHMDIADHWHTREYIELRGYEGAGYGDGGLMELIALGCTSSGVDTTVYNARILSGENWVNTTTAKVADWVKLSAVITSSAVEVYVNDVLNYSGPRSPDVTFDCVVLGSGLSSHVDVHFDDLNIQVIPEPGTLILLGLGGLALIRRR